MTTTDQTDRLPRCNGKIDAAQRRDAGEAHLQVTQGHQGYCHAAQFRARKSMKKDCPARQRRSRRLPVRLTVWCSTV